MQQIYDAAEIAKQDTLTPEPTAESGQADAQAIVTGAVAAAADAIEQHVPEGPFKPLAHVALQTAIMFAIKGIFRRR